MATIDLSDSQAAPSVNLMLILLRSIMPSELEYYKVTSPFLEGSDADSSILRMRSTRVLRSARQEVMSLLNIDVPMIQLMLTKDWKIWPFCTGAQGIWIVYKACSM